MSRGGLYKRVLGPKRILAKAAVTLRHWEYTCGRCNAGGSCPVDPNVSMLNATHEVRKAHAAFNPECDAIYQGRWVRILRVTED